LDDTTPGLDWRRGRLGTRRQGLAIAHGMTTVALFASLTCVGASIRVPISPVPFTLQGFFVTPSGLLLGSWRGALSQALYVLVGLLGVPVFAAGGGIGYVAHPSFGYLLGYVAGASWGGLITERISARGWPALAPLFGASLAVMVSCYAVGGPYLYLVLNHVFGIPTSVGAAFKAGCLVFLPWDLAKACAASWVAWQVTIRLLALGMRTRGERP